MLEQKVQHEIGSLLEAKEFAYHDQRIGQLFTELRQPIVPVRSDIVEQERWNIAAVERRGKEVQALSEAELIQYLLAEKRLHLTTPERAEVFFEKRIGAGFSVNKLVEEHFGPQRQDALTMVIAPQVLTPNLATWTVHATAAYMTARGYPTELKACQYDTDVWTDDANGMKRRYIEPRLATTGDFIETPLHGDTAYDGRMLKQIPLEGRAIEQFMQQLGYTVDVGDRPVALTDFHNELVKSFGMNIGIVDKPGMDMKWLNHKLRSDGEVGRDWSNVSILEHDNYGYRGAYTKFPKLRKRYRDGIPLAEQGNWRMHSDTYYRRFPMQLAPYAIRPDLVLIESFADDPDFVAKVQHGQAVLTQLVGEPKIVNETWVSGADILGNVEFDGVTTNYRGNGITSVDIPAAFVHAEVQQRYYSELSMALDLAYPDIADATIGELHQTINVFTLAFLSNMQAQ